MPVSVTMPGVIIRSVVFLIAAALCVLNAQQTDPPHIHFDVASVRVNRTAGCPGRWDLTGDRVSGPAWLDSECYDIKAKAPAGAPERDLMPMLQALLIERFHLVARLESDERPVFALVADQGWSKDTPLRR